MGRLVELEALRRGRRAVANPYGDGDSARRIVEILASFGDFRALTRKRFVDLPGAA